MQNLQQGEIIEINNKKAFSASAANAKYFHINEVLGQEVHLSWCAFDNGEPQKCKAQYVNIEALDISKVYPIGTRVKIIVDPSSAPKILTGQTGPTALILDKPFFGRDNFKYEDLYIMVLEILSNNSIENKLDNFLR